MVGQKIPQPVGQGEQGLVENILLPIGIQQRLNHIVPGHCAEAAGFQGIRIGKAEKHLVEPEFFEIQVGPHMGKQDNAALPAQQAQGEILPGIGGVAHGQGSPDAVREPVLWTFLQQHGFGKIRLDFCQVPFRNGAVQVDANQVFRDDRLIQKGKQALQLAIPGQVGIQAEILLVFFEQPDKIRLEQHPGLGHIPVQLLGHAVNHLVPVGRGAGIQEIPEGLDNVHHVPGVGGGQGVGPAVIVVKGTGNVTDVGVTGHQGRDQGNILKQHFFIPVILPDPPAKQFIDAVGNIISVGDIIRQVNFRPGIGSHHGGAVLLHIDDFYIAHDHVVVPLGGFLVHDLVHVRLYRVVTVQEGHIFPGSRLYPGVPGVA